MPAELAPRSCSAPTGKSNVSAHLTGSRNKADGGDLGPAFQVHLTSEAELYLKVEDMWCAAQESTQKLRTDAHSQGCSFMLFHL